MSPRSNAPVAKGVHFPNNINHGSFLPPAYLQGLPPPAQLQQYVLLSQVAGVLLRLQPLFQSVLVRAEGQRYLAEGRLGVLQKERSVVRGRLSRVGFIASQYVKLK